MIITTLIVAVLLIVALLAVAAMQPAEFHVTRSLSIAVPASVLFEQVNDLHLWEAWSPWIKMEPDVKKSFSGPASGIGARYSWEGKKTGSGRMTTIECRPNELLRFDLRFEKPFKAQNVAEFSFKPEGGETVVTWSMTGKNNFVGKAFGLVVNCDKMCGDQFISGLQNLKAVTEEAVPA